MQLLAILLGFGEPADTPYCHGFFLARNWSKEAPFIGNDFPENCSQIQLGIGGQVDEAFEGIGRGIADKKAVLIR